MRHLSLASSFILLTLLGALGLGTEVSALTYPVGVPTGEIAGGAYRTYFDNIFSSEVNCYNTGKVVGGFTSTGAPICVVPAPVGLNILGSTAGDTLRYNGTDWIRNNLLYNNGTNIGIGTTTPGAKLEIAGQVKITGGTPGLGKILTSDAAGLATWAVPSATNQVCPGTGTGNTCYGIGAGNSMTTGFQNTANGSGALYSNTTGNRNTANGYWALYSNTTGMQNTANGHAALLFNTTGVFNTANGKSALYNNISGTQNTANGAGAIQANITGNYNTANGALAGSSLTSGDNNIFIGYGVQPNISTTASNQLNIGDWIYGNSGSIGIGVLNPGAKLDIAGNIKIADGSQGTGKVLTSDVNGLATWTTVSATNQVCPGTGAGNTCYGIGAGSGFTTGAWNTANGHAALTTNTTGSNNTANGQAALYANTTGGDNTANGVRSLQANTTGGSNTADGVMALYSNITGNYNIAFGSRAGQNLTAGDNNIFLGYNVQPNISTTASNQLNIGNWIYGNSGSIGIGVLNPGAKLEIAGQIKITGGTPGVGKVLTSDATGLATWANASASNQVCPGTGSGNTCYGIGAGSSITTGYQNTANGQQALTSNTTGYQNTANGALTLSSNTTGFQNTAAGVNAMNLNTSGSYNTANGQAALYSNTTGNSNVANGHSSLFSNTTGNWNVGNGVKALFSNTSGSYNVAVGYQSLLSNTTGVQNVANGYNALYSNTTGNNNTANGVSALYANTTGNNNTANGYQALFTNSTGANNTANGVSALSSNTTGYYNTANGVNTLYSNTTGYQNTANGVGALYWNTTGYQNTANGVNALSSNTTGNYNVANGVSALLSNSTGSHNTANGFGALLSNTIGYQNTANGAGALYWNTTGFQNTADGVNALKNNTTGSNNVAIGVNTLFSNTTGNANTANGLNSLYFNTTGIQNTALGMNALYSNTIGNNNTAFGYQALYLNSTGSSNTAFGLNALYSNTIGYNNTANGLNALLSNTTGYQNTADGQSALYTNITGYHNTANGVQALFLNTTGYSNAAYGVNSLYANTTGNYNVALGRNAGSNLVLGDNNIFIGYNAQPNIGTGASNQLNIGNWLYGNGGNIGIGVLNPGAKLEVAGQIKITGGTPGAGKVLTSDATGLATWTSTISGATATGITGGSGNYIPKFGTGGTGLYISQLFDNGTNVGIGTPSPTYKLDVYGNGRFTGNLTVSGSLIVDKLVNRTVNNISISGSILPDTAAPLVYRDIGSNAQRWNNLYLSGQVTIAGGSPGLGKILMSDANGLATWTNSISGATATGITGGSGNYIPKFGTGGTGLYSSVIYQNGTNIAIGTGTATAKLTLDSGLANTAGLRLTRLTTTSPTYTGAVVGLGIDASGNVVPVSNGDVVVYDGIGRNGAAPTPNPNIANREISYDFNRYFLIPTKQSFVVSDGNGAGYNAPYFKEDGVSGLCSWNGASGTSPYDCATADPYTGLSASPNNSFTMTARGTSYGYQIALGARGDAPLFARSGKWYNATSNYGSGLYLADGTTPTPWQKVLTVPANHIEYFYVNIGYNSQLQAISGGGNIGMGTSTPDMRLVLAYSGSTGSTSEMMRIERGLKGADANMITTFGTPYILIGGKETRTNSIQTIGFGYNTGSSYQPAEIGLVTTNTAGNTQGDLVFATRSGTTNVAPTERMRIFGNGSIGIGTSTVASRFEVWSGATTLFHMRGTNNIGMGIGSVRSLLSGNANTGFGNESLYTLTTGYSNSAFGHQALRQSTTGYNNSAFGKEAMYNDNDGTWNTALGYQALRSASSSDYNVAIGGQTLYTLGTGTGNVAIGHNALYGATTSASSNIAIGYMAGSGLTTGWNNIVIGNAAQARTSTGSNQLNIGNWIYGNGGNIGVGVSNPTAKLEVAGLIKSTLNGVAFLQGGDDSTLNDVNMANTLGIMGVQNPLVGSLQLGSNTGTYIYGNGTNIGIGTTIPGAKLDINGTFKLGTAGTATTAAGTCTIASTAITTTATTYTCTGIPASTSVALSCSAAGAFTTPGTTGLYCRANGFANSITCNTTVANTNAMTYKCMWMQ